MGILKVEIMLGFDSISSASPYLLQKQEVFSLHQWSREVPGRFERLEKWIKDAELFFEESNLAQLAQVRATGALRAELERFSLSSLMNQELRAANEQMNSPTPQQRKAVQERLQVPTVADSRLSAGMNAFRRLRGG